MSTLEMIGEAIFEIALVCIYVVSLVFGVIGYATILMALHDGDFTSARGLVLYANPALSIFLVLGLLSVYRSFNSLIPSVRAKMKTAVLLIALFTVLSIRSMNIITTVNLTASLVAVVVPLGLQLLVSAWAICRLPKNSPQLAG